MRNQILDSRQLLAFCALARHRNFTQAAAELCLTQSAVSHAIKALEDDVGTRLADREGRRVSLTQAGEQFLQYAERILTEMAAVRTNLDATGRWGHGRLRVGASTTACQYILPTVLREFRESFPKCVISIEPGDSAHQLDLLAANKVDLMILPGPVPGRACDFIPIFEDELRFLVSPSHAWARLRRVPRESIEQETLVLYHKASITFRLVSDYFRREHVSLGHYIELGSMEATKELVKTGLGAGVLALWIARAELASGALVELPLGRRRLYRQWGIAYRKGRRLTLGEETFVGLCRSVTEGYTPELRRKEGTKPDGIVAAVNPPAHGSQTHSP